jgi:NAD(P)-dependent dehydrogenase (short-subunit alcohol dehydrogenase family)
VTELIEGHEDTTLTLSLDVTDAAQVSRSVSSALARFGVIDVLVNNAGYGYQSSIEEGVESEIRAQFDTNVFGLAAMIRAILPGMRARRTGQIVNISSVAGMIGFPGSGYYAASKHAVEGLSDALRREIAPLGIKVVCIEPGPFRTDWAGRSLKQTPSAIADYVETVADRMRNTIDKSGTQPVDPVRAARAIIKIVQEDAPPAHLVLGAFGVQAITAKLVETLGEVERWTATSLGSDYPTSA